MPEVFELFAAFRWTIGNYDVVLPVARIQSSLKNRVVPHKRIYRPGARHDNTGPEPRTWELTFLAHNDSDESEVPTNYYPDELVKLEDSMAEDGTGTLYTSRGPRRCMLEQLTVVEDRREGSDAASVVAIFVEDNEDDVTASSFQAPSARSAAQGQLLLTATMMNAAGVGGGNFFDSLKEATASLVALASGPGNTVAELEREEQIVTDSILQIEDAYASAGAGGVAEMTALLTDPMSAAPGRALRRLQDTCARAAFDKASGFQSAAIRIRTYSSSMSIYEIATDVDQDAYDLMQLNDSLATPNNIPPGTPVRVFA